MQSSMHQPNGPWKNHISRNIPPKFGEIHTSNVDLYKFSSATHQK